MPSPLRSLPRLCVALGVRTATELSRAAEHEYRDGNNFLEFRLDYLDEVDAGLRLIAQLTRRYSDLKVLATFRSVSAGGRFQGTLDEQKKVLHQAARAGATALDLEIESAERDPSAVDELRQQAPVIVSLHDYQRTPPLAAAFRRLQRIEADGYKLVTTACKYTDNLRFLEFLRSEFAGGRPAAESHPLIAFTMSEIGSPTRVLSPALGCLYTYAAPDYMEGTADGQIPGRTMRKLYRCERLTLATRVFGVLADPVAHSKSPLLHNRAFQARRIDAVYLPFRVTARDLPGWMQFAATLPVHGFSVTIPHKQRIVKYLDIVEPLAKRIGAVNTVWRKGGKWRGANTDVDGILAPLRRRLRLAHASVLVAGTGGAARAAATALSDAGANVTVSGRNLAAARTLARAAKAEALPWQAALARNYDVLLHATPVGMHPNHKHSLFSGTLPARIVFDMVYNPHQTALLQQAEAQGSTVIHGSEMLLEQALRQFEIWTGDSAPRAVMSRVLDEALTTA